MSSKRKDILDAIKTKLETISIINGYNHDISKISKDFFHYSQVPADEFPALCLVVGDSNYHPLTQEEYTSGNSTNDINGWFISIMGYVTPDESDEELLSDKKENLIEDIVKCILSDHTLGLSGYVRNAYLAAIYDHSANISDNLGAVQVVFNIKYDFNKSSP